MTQNERKRNYSERLYIEDGLTAKKIAQTIGATEKTVGNWVAKYNWKDKRLQNQNAPHKIKQLLLEGTQKLLNGQELPFNPDHLSKISKALERIDKSVNTHIVISILKEFDTWLAMQDIDNKFLQETLNVHQKFIRQRIENEQ